MHEIVLPCLSLPEWVQNEGGDKTKAGSISILLHSCVIEEF